MDHLYFILKCIRLLPVFVPPPPPAPPLCIKIEERVSRGQGLCVEVNVCCIDYFFKGGMAQLCCEESVAVGFCVEVCFTGVLREELFRTRVRCYCVNHLVFPVVAIPITLTLQMWQCYFCCLVLSSVCCRAGRTYVCTRVLSCLAP